ncbi:uncharacterized protein LOC118453921 [Neolamprologus brichardi]|uniref:uncharacterized protein LOC118453921 n=1 Tax=Neolamprologus brichardi TaxID=32507 RepID=UPI001643CA2D|nr:uncharacterized protein LOC118453921 [Neolamprologus brichardi]
MERLLKMEPKVECTLDSMTLQVHDAASTPGSLLFVDRGNHLSPLPLSKLPSSCGYTISSTRRDLVLVAPYDGCFVALQEDTYVLPLLWWGIPVRMSCPFMGSLSLNPPMVTCNTADMLVKTEWTLPVSNIKVKLNGKWEPLTVASNRCGFSTVEHPEGVVISAHYAPCLEKKDGLYTLEVAGDGEATISCPSQLPRKQNPKHRTNFPTSITSIPNQSPKYSLLQTPPLFLSHHSLKPLSVKYTSKCTCALKISLPEIQMLLWHQQLKVFWDKCTNFVKHLRHQLEQMRKIQSKAHHLFSDIHRARRITYLTSSITHSSSSCYSL